MYSMTMGVLQSDKDKCSLDSTQQATFYICLKTGRGKHKMEIKRPNTLRLTQLCDIIADQVAWLDQIWWSSNFTRNWCDFKIPGPLWLSWLAR